ncbi:MAG: Glycosyl transferase group 1 [Candidatus Beckwithbacteria bacterium GW2011_GWB1_47_15]|uniref:Glycosyl transferase group 1 n=1 Tax=Candidatus Beckwithbacteria bacterium GW2011_GWB1_47_15 TaxID=1618371 RepID=A0A0G1RVV5_9BACT|nr:MAG: trehalose phosphorylase [Candidatus Beckwithbacteria bacterium GW2011_GWC1_49_16]KKU34988.1 MAG: Glycosyl transferase group 1 [Candidatus Beckwithbacteria bacterium GW2011_GWA1_46_30]KKU61267.1 MAG: Glycosyl transferase group 1 [Candidatus Beckwithbacteria bacterium GW2011_GWB1_47_15]KKU71439.1 MAG: Glycosyl transferase group 1 [Candidatus Beckwithbacteria bacterium GW2011_GWA2_47_25]OGD48417.1 MAG: hypothetical protein A2877_03170 [Candidatus Beckwithbacteria bacterium RIFCSPHIGHO2_01_
MAKLSQELTDLYRRIGELGLPTLSFAAIHLNSKGFSWAELGRERGVTYQKVNQGKKETDFLIAWIKKRMEAEKVKYVAVNISGKGDLEELGAGLWLKLDAVPLIDRRTKNPSKRRLDWLARRTQTKFEADDVVKVKLKSRNQVEVAWLVRSQEYEKVDKKWWRRLVSQAEEFGSKKILFINATPRGGGVAMMRHALVRLYKLIGVDARWHVLQERAEAFEVTKRKFHNVLQGAAGRGVSLTGKDRQVYEAWIGENAEMLKPVIERADVVVIDDPQPSGLIKFIRRWAEDKKIIYRSHIHLDSKLINRSGTAARRSFEYIWANAKKANVFISHPMLEFIPKVVSRDQVVLWGAATDPWDGINKPLTRAQTNYYLKRFNKILLEEGQEPLDLTRDYIIQIARFDPSKGIEDVLEAFRLLRAKMESKPPRKARLRGKPQLVLAGHGSIDDPDGAPIFNLISGLVGSQRYRHLKDDIKIARLPAVDQILNALLRRSKVALQLSHKEGFEIKVTEALMKGVPVVSYNVGGIPLQIKDGVSGLVVKKTGNTRQVAEKLYRLLTDKRFYQKMSRGAKREAIKEGLTVPNAAVWLYLANKLVE